MYTYKPPNVVHCQEATTKSPPGIYYDSLTRTFRLRGKNSIYAFRVDDNRNLEHLYWGSAIPLEDDLLFLGFGNNPTPFDPKGYIGDSWESSNPLGFVDLKQLSPEEVAERWKTYTVEAHTPRATEPRRLENASWRLWNMDKMRRIGSTWSGMEEEQPTHPLDSCTLEHSRESATYDDSHPKSSSSMEVVYDDEPWSEVSSCIRTDSMGTGHSSSEKEEESNEEKRRISFRKNLSRRSPSLRRGEGLEKGFANLENSEDEFLSCNRFGSFASPTPRQQQQNIWINLDPEIVGKNTKLLEYSDRGTGDYRSCSFELEYSDGTTLSPLVYSSHRIFAGKLSPHYPLPGLFVNTQDDATTLEMTMIDPLTKVCVILYYTVFHEYDVIVRRTLFRNNLDESLIIRRCFSCTQDFDTDDFYLTQLSGSWARERQMVTKKLYQGIALVESTRGASSHQHNPFAVVTIGTPIEDQGEAFAFNLVYSGNFRLEAELVESGRLRVNMGINPQQFSWNLGPGEEFSTPEVVLCYSGHGLGGISQQYHRLYRYHLIPPRWRNKVCPVLINTWEAMYFNVTHEAVVELAKRAKECGIELVVLDDGWFGNRNNTRSGLGDWKANRMKFPFGLEGLCREINELGLHFGIWMEPEMVNIESELYHKHPDWCLHIPRRARTTGRNQLVLDFSQEAVRNHVIGEVSNILSSCNIEYVKWDMNRHLTEVFSQAFSPERQGEIAHRHILGVYEAFARITSAFPHVLIESCSGGGGRFDPGMLYYSAQIWCSDNTDALSRVQIQYGTSLVYPICSIGSHVSSIPNHQTLRSTTMKTRSLVAMCGTFGYEMDVRQLSREEVEEIKSYVELRNEFAPLILFGTMYRLWNPFWSDSGAWMFVSEEKTEAIVIAVNLNRQVGLQLPRMHLRGIREDWVYLVEELCPGKLRTNVSTGAIETDPSGVFQWSTKTGGVTLKLSGRTLMKVGLPVKFIFEEIKHKECDEMVCNSRTFDSIPQIGENGNQFGKSFGSACVAMQMYRDRYPYYDGEVYDDTGVVPPENVERRPNGRRVIVEEPEEYGMPDDRDADDEQDGNLFRRGRDGHSMQPWSQSPFEHFDRLFENPFHLDRGGFGGLFGNLEQSLRRLEEDFARGAGKANGHVYSYSSRKHFGPNGEVYEESTTTTKEGNRTEVRRHLKDSIAGNEEYTWKREIDGRGREVIRKRDGSGQEITKENYYNLTPEERELFEQQWRTPYREGLDWNGYEGDVRSVPQLSDKSWTEQQHSKNEHHGGLGGFFRKLFKRDHN